MLPYRVLVVDDSLFMRKIITDLIEETGRFQVVGTAKNGKEAVELAKDLVPDLITMDIEMPEMNGLEALQIIMERSPIPVIMLSSLTSEGAAETIRALELGAVDFVRKPSGSISLDLYKMKHFLLEKLEIAVQTNVSNGGLKSRHHRLVRNKVVKPQTTIRSDRFKQVVVIGASTGGPRALHEVLSQIPAPFPAPLLIVQHMPPNFTKSLALRLHEASQITVVEAEAGMKVRSGTAYVAPGGWHMKLIQDSRDNYVIALSKEQPRSGHRPSVNVLLESLLPLSDLQKHIVIMTGMGRDGASGLKTLKHAGTITAIAEDESTCVVYGMPKVAIETGCITHILPQHQIAARLVESVMSTDSST